MNYSNPPLNQINTHLSSQGNNAKMNFKTKFVTGFAKKKCVLIKITFYP